MIHITEDFLYTLIVTRIKHYKKNPHLLSTNFISGNKSSIEKLQKYLTNPTSNIFIEHNFPRDPARIPIISIILSNEQSSPESLGSVLPLDSTDNILSYKEELTPIYHTDNTLIIKTSNYPILEGDITSITTKKKIPLSEFNQDLLRQGIIKSSSVSFTEGMKYEIEYKYKSSELTQYGYEYNTQYRIEVYSDNADLTVMLYSLVKMILIECIPILEDYGYRLIDISGTDFEPMPDYFNGIFLYRRGIVLGARVVESVQTSSELVKAVSSIVHINDILLETSGKADKLIELADKKIYNADIDGIGQDLKELVEKLQKLIL